MLRTRLDKVVKCYEQSVVEHDKTQQTKLQQYKQRNIQLQAQIRELEIENLKYASALEDDAEKIAELEGREDKLRVEVAFLGGNLEVERAETEARIKALKSEMNYAKAENAVHSKEMKKMMDLLDSKDARIQQLTRELDWVKFGVGKENVGLSSRVPSRPLPMGPTRVNSMSRALVGSPSITYNMDDGTSNNNNMVTNDATRRQLHSAEKSTAVPSSKHDGWRWGWGCVQHKDQHWHCPRETLNKPRPVDVAHLTRGPLLLGSSLIKSTPCSSSTPTT
jgi:hypothetical protein